MNLYCFPSPSCNKWRLVPSLATLGKMRYTALGLPLAIAHIDRLYKQQQRQTIPTYKRRSVLSYDGPRYSGRQYHASTPTIQSILEQAITRATDLCLGGASRTDKGIHALGKRNDAAARQLSVMDESKKEKSSILIIGATGGFGFDAAKASLEFSHPTFCLVRPSAYSDPEKCNKIKTLTDSGAVILEGSLHDEESLIEAIKQVKVVICALNWTQVLDQKPLISAIKKVGCIERFFPSEFDLDCEKVDLADMDEGYYANKTEIRRLIEAEGIPYTYVSCNYFISYFLPSLVQPGLEAPPRDKVTIYGDGNVKGVFITEKDVAAFTMRTVEDPRTLNKVLYLRPPGNVVTMNELVELWEQKIGKQLEKIYVSEEDLLKKIKETPMPDKWSYIFIYAAFVKGYQTGFDVESAGGFEGSALYPDVKYTTISTYLDTLV